MDEPTVVEGVVAHGDRRGRELGFPTANLLDPRAVRLDGVYAAVTVVDGDPTGARPAVVSVGRRPTYYGGQGVRLLEAHLLDWSGDLYGRHLRVELHQRLRPQRAFAGSIELMEQIACDVDEATAWARANGWSRTPGTTRRGHRGRWARVPAQTPGRSARTLARARRRTAAIAEAAAGVPPEALTHDGVAAATGIPAGYLRWRFPEVEDLAAQARAAGVA
ncbi:riboflavin kinase [Kineococcus sp. SYSU DK001]|uniref:riboflavin kinase n=1 Tax=Kineococcus sp. SYSU DK001 TaxID=3383122 RepID=UPI003D7CA93F